MLWKYLDDTYCKALLNLFWEYINGKLLSGAMSRLAKVKKVAGSRDT